MKNFTKIIYTILTVIFLSTPACWATRKTTGATINTNIPKAIDVTVTNPAQAVGTIDGTTGNCTNMAAEFKIKSNNSSSYDLGMTATAVDGGGIQNAFFQIAAGDFIALANADSIPTAGSIAAAKMTTPTQSANPDVIAYQLAPWHDPTGNIDLVMTNGAGPNFTGWYYQITKGSGAINGSVKITLNTAPHTNTYSSEYDGAGTYQSIVKVSAYTL